ncbi:MAG: aldo/keto reductase [SAR202 cluster bacterium]|nr:aldo/keto reductase [SAR202 cluster bacterium]
MNKLNDSIKRVKYGNTSLYVPRICQGTAFRNMPRADDNQIGLKVLQHSLDIGSNFFDTAPGYGAGGAQRLLGKALSGRRHQAIIADRILNRDIPLDGKEGDEFPLAKYTKEYIFNATEKSLKRINTDYLDILSIHLKDGFVKGKKEIPAQDYLDQGLNPDPTPPEEVSFIMDELVKSGKVRYWGLSQHNFEDVTNYVNVCKTNNLTPLSSLQNNYSLMARGQVTEELFPVIKSANLGVQTIGPHAAGRLTPSFIPESGSPEEELLNVIDSVANDLGVLRTHINIAWVLSHQHLTTALAGAESTQHIEDNIQGANITIPTNLLIKLNDASNIYTTKINK